MSIQYIKLDQLLGGRSRGSSLGNEIISFAASGASIAGNDLHIVPGRDYSTMYGIVLNTDQTPYRFQLSDNVDELGKRTDNTVIANGRQGVVWSGDGQVYGMLGDITVDGQSIPFVSLPDSIKVEKESDLNKYLHSQPFSLTDKSEFFYSVRFHCIGDSAVAQMLSDGGNVSASVQLIDAQTKAVIGEYDQVTFSGNDYRRYRNIGHQIDARGIGSRTVQLRLSISGSEYHHYSLVQRRASDVAVNLGKGKRNRSVLGFKGGTPVTEYSVSQNYPNPFNPSTTISYALPQDGLTTLKVYDALGREVAELVNEFKTTGRYTASFDASRLSSGVYIYKLVSGKYTASKKMMLVK